MQQIEVTVNKTNGLHVRMAATLIAKLQSLLKDANILKNIYVLYNGKKIPITSLLAIVSLKIKKGEKIALLFEEEVHPRVIGEIKAFIENEQGDFSDQLQTDQLLIENSITVEAVLSSLPNGIIVVNKENRITYVNKEATELLEISDDQLLNQRADIVIPHSRLQYVLQTGKTEIAKPQQLGSRVIITNRSPILFDDEIVGAVALFQDISAVEELSKELKEVKELKKQLELVLHSVEDLIALSDQQGNFIYCNPGIDSLLKRLKKKNSVQSILGKEKCNVVFQSFQSIAELVYLEQEYPYITKLNPILVDGEFRGTILTMSPFHETKSLLEQLDIEKERAKYLEQELSRHEALNDSFTHIVGYSEELIDSLAIANKVAKSDSTILITGESGTGKELVAKGVHEASQRKGKPFIRVNCAAIPANLIESELFGHEKGAFTGAFQMRRGKFELAHTGTIFLDEIGDLNFELQAKLLRVLQEREVERIGGNVTIKLDVRVIAATNHDLQKMVQNGDFREDLYYRLNVIPIHLPPLRKRKLDIPLLVDYFRVQFNECLEKNIKSYENGFMDSLMEYNWPGNIRELENVLERAINLSEGEKLRLKDLPDYIYSSSSKDNGINISLLKGNKILPMEEYEKEILKYAIQFFPSFNAAGKALGMTHKTVASKVRKYNLEAYLGKKYQPG
ncbi:sigma 54-interacting transcriptional regulator [Aneurinibacillus terranovensis]|uniref:sigma 54-interacting transcriptional regulator n=1 Tax=Aneurinibacillus terranovensis TaxID=278991 RepID=UPI00040F78E9|nr:sigma 54-interacting transcriptional regulator [Aneurinibacillus terranovensis]